MSTSREAPWLLVGLGNPGPQYAKTRHNIGFRCLERMQAQGPFSSWKLDKRANALLAVCNPPWQGIPQPIHLMLPQTYMNLSGRSAAGYLRYHQWREPERVIMIYDEAALPFGRLRVRPKGSDAGHNGVKSMHQELSGLVGKSVDVARLRLGIGQPPHPAMAMKDYVLGVFSAEEERDMDAVLDRAVDALVVMMRDGVQTAMNGFNGA